MIPRATATNQSNGAEEEDSDEDDDAKALSVIQAFAKEGGRTKKCKGSMDGDGTATASV